MDVCILNDAEFPILLLFSGDALNNSRSGSVEFSFLQLVHLHCGGFLSLSEGPFTD